MNFRCKCRHLRWIRRPQFPIRVQNFGDLATFFVDFCILYTVYPTYFYFRFVWPTDLESIPHASTPTSIIPTKFEVGMTIILPSYSVFVCWYVTWPWDLWPFDPEQLTYMAGQVTNLATKYKDPTPIRSWVMSYNVCRWLPLKMRTGHCASRDQWVGGSKTITLFWNARPPFACSLYNFYWAPTTIKGR